MEQELAAPRGLRALLEGVIDYAGLFPPAQLPLDEALQNYDQYRRSPEQRMLGRFVCPASRLAEISPLLTDLLDSPRPILLTVLAGGAGALDELRADLQSIEAFEHRHGADAIVDTIELRWTGEGKALRDAVSIVESGRRHCRAFFELVRDENWTSGFSNQIDLLGGIRASTHNLGPECGAKLRCGGLGKTAFPSSGQVACAICACRDAAVPIKFTAGLHHALRHFDDGVQANVHGFLNVFAGSVLAKVHQLSQSDLSLILEDERADRFHFDDDGLTWQDWSAGFGQIVQVRRESVISFGSCSFDEPREGLRALGLLA